MNPTSCDPINPYTATETFGVPYNGGYKPDPYLEWIPPNDNMVDLNRSDDDEFSVPFFVTPPGVLMNTCEGRRADPREPIKGYELDYDDFIVEGPSDPPVVPMSMKRSGPIGDEEKEMAVKILLVATIIVAIMWVSRI
jgi:hypothetical protein